MIRTITALTAQKKNPNRINVYLDGDFAFGLSRLVAAWLRLGQELDEEKINSLIHKDAEEVIFQRVAHFQSYRPRTEKEIRQHLLKNDYEPVLIDVVIDQMKEKGLINDLKFAQLWVENRALNKPRGQIALSMELQQKGVNREDIEEALSQMENEKDLAIIAARKYVSRLNIEDLKLFRVKLGAFLGRRGFTYEVISDTVSEVWKELKSSQNTEN